MAVYRVQRTRDYTVMSNYHLKDKGLTLKSKGLLSMILSLPEEWNYTTRGLASICKEGVDAIGSALKELETAGYIVRRQLRGANGRITDTEYVIYEQPQPKKLDMLPVGYGFTRYGKPGYGKTGYGKARRIKYREIKYKKINYLWIKYRFHSLPGNSGGKTAGTERKGCDVCHRDRKLSGIDFGEYRV